MAAKVTRDAWIEGWIYEEDTPSSDKQYDSPSTSEAKRRWASEFGSGYPSGSTSFLSFFRCAPADPAPRRPQDKGMDQLVTRSYIWVPLFRPLFMDDSQGLPRERGTRRSMVRRFHLLLPLCAQLGHPTRSCRIDDGQASLVKAFESASGRDKERCAVTRDLFLSSVGTL